MTNLKKYTLQDLKEDLIAVRLKTKDEIRQLSNALSINVGSLDIDKYYRVYNNELDWAAGDYLTMNNYTLLESIDEIDLGEGKEEVLTTPVKVRTVEFLENLVREYESEIARLKGENEELKDKYCSLFKSFKELEKSTPLAVLESTTDLEKRERMAWEIWLQGRYTVEQAIEKVNHFLEESKEVGNG